MGGPMRSCILHPPNAHARPSGLSTVLCSLAWYVVPPQRPALRYDGPRCSFSTLRSAVHGVKETSGIACLRCPLVRNATIRNRAKHRYRIEGCNVNHCQPEPLYDSFKLLVLRRHSVPVFLYIAFPECTQTLWLCTSQGLCGANAPPSPYRLGEFSRLVLHECNEPSSVRCLKFRCNVRSMSLLPLAYHLQGG
jgi:hypothetical protein